MCSTTRLDWTNALHCPTTTKSAAASKNSFRARTDRCLLAVLGRHGFHERDAGQPRLSRQPPDLDRRRRRRGDADGAMQDDGHTARDQRERLMITLYHCDGARSFRPLWMLEELGLPY